MLALQTGAVNTRILLEFAGPNYFEIKFEIKLHILYFIGVLFASIFSNK